MNAHVRDALVDGYEHLMDSIVLPDKHAPACCRSRYCFKCRCDCHAAYNLKDFPNEALVPFELQAIHPASFIHDLIDLHPAEFIGSMDSHSKSVLKKSTNDSVDEYLARTQKTTVTGSCYLA